MGEEEWLCLPGSSTVGGTIVDEVVDHRGIDIGRRDYRTIKEGGRKNKYKASITKQLYYTTEEKLSML